MLIKLPRDLKYHEPSRRVSSRHRPTLNTFFPFFPFWRNKIIIYRKQHPKHRELKYHNTTHPRFHHFAAPQPLTTSPPSARCIQPSLEDSSTQIAWIYQNTYATITHRTIASTSSPSNHSSPPPQSIWFPSNTTSGRPRSHHGVSTGSGRISAS